MDGAALPAEDGLVEVRYYFDWWDCPRCGVTIIDGTPMHFESPFDERLDDYVAEFYLWPMSSQDLANADEAWREFAAWRARFDAGEEELPPFEQTEVARRLSSWQHEPPATAMRAVPEWRLDADRSFVDGHPQHKVRWHFVNCE